MKKLKRTFPILIFLIFFQPSHAKSIQQDLDYQDALETLENPGVGFYRTQGYHFKTSGNTATNTWGNICHLRMDISEFSDKAILNIDSESNDTTYGISQPLTQDVLDALDATLDGVRKRGKTAIIRFSYDKNFGGATKCDPDQSIILGHLKQLGEVYGRNIDVIQYIELGMYGSWGEMHSSNVGTNENIAEALQTLLVCTPPEIKIGVRRPDIVAYWLGVNEGNNYSDFDIHSEAFQKAIKAKGDTIYRVGMYNDGYLGSYSDLGTIGMGVSGHEMTREMMIQWLETYSQHTPYGGELVANYNGDTPINTPTYLSKEGFRTHTSYLNYEWHQATILGWKDSIFNGNDPEYNGTDGYTYVENHLGYRFILRDSYLPDTIYKGEPFKGEFKIENVGFGNLTRKEVVSFVIKNDHSLYEIMSNAILDARNWLSTDTTTETFQLSLPEELPEGTYNLYLRISEYGDLSNDKNYHCIQFGNISAQYDDNIGANKIGQFTYSKESTKSYDPKETQTITIKEGLLKLNEEGIIHLYTLKGESILNKKVQSYEEIDLKKYSEEIIMGILQKGNKYTYLKIINKR